MEWQPIETAPRDGTTVLLWAPHWRTPETGWTFGNDPWQGCRKDTHTKAPTHWLAVPPPPRSEGNRVGASYGMGSPSGLLQVGP